MPSHRTAAKKRELLKFLLAGESPGAASLRVGITRKQAYVWRKADPKFAEKWEDAVATGIDLLESAAYKRAIDSSDAMMTLLLKCRRPETFNPPINTNITGDGNNANRLISWQEAMAEIKRLGLPPPLLESDYIEVEDAGPTNGSDDPA